MFIPIGDSPNSPGTPWVTRSLVAVNVLVYVLITLPNSRSLGEQDRGDTQMLETLERMWELQGPSYSAAGVSLQQWIGGLSRYDLIVFEYGYVPAEGDWWDLLSCMFLHGGFLHLAGNMLYLWIFGDNVESRLGPLRFLLAYLLTGAAGTGAFALLDPDGVAPLVGASGAISGMLGFYFVWFPRNRVKVLMALWPFLLDVVQVRAIWALAFYFVVQNLFPALAGTQDGVAYMAHIGGFVAGAGAGWALGHFLPPAPMADPPEPFRFQRRPRAAGGAELVDDSALRIEQLMRSGRMAEAAELLPRALDRGDPVRLVDALQLGEFLFERGEFVRAEAVFRTTLRGQHTGVAAAHAHLRLGQILAEQGRVQPARSHLLDCLDVAPPGWLLASQARELLERLD